MKVTILGSGSSGNAILVESGRDRLLIDAGFSGRELERRLASVEVEASSITGLLITHDHSDHTHGMGVVARRWKIPLYLTEATRAASNRLLRGEERVHLFANDAPLLIGDLRVDPFLTLHDAVDPVAVTVSETTTGEKVGIATDLGRPTPTVRQALQDCDLLVLEANHDELLLRNSFYPWSVKSRIAGSHGHLSNDAAAKLVRELYHDRLGGVVLAHLSQNTNHPRLAQEVVGAALEGYGYTGELLLGKQHEALPPIEVTRLKKLRLPPQLPLL